MTPPHRPRTPGTRLAWPTLAIAMLLGGCAAVPLDLPPPSAGRATAAFEPAPVVQAAAVHENETVPAATAELPVTVPATPPGVPAVVVPPTDAAAVAVDPVRPNVAVDLDDRSAQVDLWARVRQGFAMPDLDSPLVRQREQWYATRPDYMQRMTERGSRYLFHIVEEVQRRGLPTELALLPFIESAFNPQAMSVAKASGMWQFMPATGRDFDLQQNLFRDDRRDVLASTRAALDYLTRLHDMFGDWHLALAAYNWGEGSVQRAIARNQKAGLPTDYQSLRMPDETRHYVPKLQAVKNIVADPQAFNIELPELQNHPYFLAVAVERDIDVALVTRLAEVPVEHFKQLNPQLNKPVILAAGTPQVLLPYDNANIFVRALQRHKGPLATWTAWVAPRTLRPSEAAQMVGMSESELREVNRIPPRMLVKAGSALLVPRVDHRAADVSEHLADHAMLALAPDVPPLRRVVFRAGRKGDTVASVARRYRTSATQVARWNDVGAGARFKAGAQIVVFVPNKGARTAGTSVATARTAAARDAKVARAGAPASSKARATKVAASKKAGPVRTAAARKPASRVKAAAAPKGGVRVASAATRKANDAKR